MENKLISGVLNCIYAIQFTVESYAAAINEIKKYQQDESKAITTTSETQAREINDQCELERLQLQSEGEAIVTEAATYHSSAVAHEREFSLLDKHYNKKKQRLEVDSSYVYSFENVQDPEEELRLIAEKIEKTGIGLLQKKSVFDSFSRKRTRQYAEIKYLLCRATEINENVQNKIPESLQMHFDEIHSHISDARQEIVESLSVKQKQLSTDINSMLEKADDNLIKNLQELVPSEALYSLADEIARHEHDLVNNQALGHVDPTVMVGSVRIRIPNKESAPLVSNLLNHLYGDLILYDQLVMPLGLSLNDTCSLLITLNKETEEKIYRGIQSIIAQMLARVPPTKLNCLFVDPKNAGKFFSPFMKLSAKDEKIAGKQVFTSQESINNCLDELYKHIDHVIQFKLSSGTGFNDIYSYNAQAGDNAESYKLLAVLDYPKNFSSDMMDKLVYIMENGTRCGVHTIISYNPDYIPQYQRDEFEKTLLKLAESAHEIISCNTSVFLKTSLGQVHYEFIPPVEPLVLSAFLDQLCDQVVVASKKETPFSAIAPPADQWFSKSSSDSLVIPIGKSGAGETHSLIFGAETSQHAIIAGKTGSGKTSLLHTIITSACLNYSPDELTLYLLDFKEGVEFIEYDTYKIPHIKVLALESEQEFGESILIELQQELIRRGELFKNHEAQNIMDLRLKTSVTLPRILLIIDEFQVLFDTQKTRAVANNCAAMIDDIVRRGRSFGIHAILSSQTVSTIINSSLEPSTVSQMAVRIGLKADDKDARVLLGPENDGIASIGQEIGVAIYNSDAGRAQNIKFKIAFLEKVHRKQMLQNIAEHAISQGYKYNARVFSSQDEAYIEDATEFFEAGGEPSSCCTVWLGKSVRVAPPYVTAGFRYRNEDNIVILGQGEQLANRITLLTLCSLISQAHQTCENFQVHKIYLSDYGILNDEATECMKQVSEHASEIVTRVTTDFELQKIIKDIYELMVKRQGGNEASRRPVFLLMHGIQRMRILAKTINTEGIYSLDFSDEEIPTGKMFLKLLDEGPGVGIFTMIWADTFNSLSKYPYGTLDLFGYKVALQLREQDSERFLGNRYAVELKDKYAICKDISGECRKFQPFSVPGNAWLEKLVSRINCTSR